MAESELCAVYLAVGADAHKRAYLLERMEKRLAAQGSLEFDEDVFSGTTAQGNAIVMSCNIAPFLNATRLVVVHDADKLGKSDAEALVAYLAAPCATTVLFLEAEKLAKSTRLYKACARIDAKAVIDCAPQKARDLPAKVRGFAASRRASMTPDAAAELVARVGQDTMRLDAEVAKLVATYGQGAVIERDDVCRSVARSAEPKPWDFTDALARRDVAACLALEAQMGSTNPRQLLWRSVALLRELLIVKDMGRCSQAAIAAELGGPAWKYKHHVGWAAGFSDDELREAFVGAAALEAAMNAGGDEELLFDAWVVDVCTRRT